MKPNEIFLLVALAVTSILAIWFYMKIMKYNNAYNKHKASIISNVKKMAKITGENENDGTSKIDKMKNDPEVTFDILDKMLGAMVGVTKDAAGLARALKDAGFE